MSSVRGLVSTIIPVHNRPALLAEAVASVLQQTYRPIEILIVDDGSTDHTAVVADELLASHPATIRVLHQNNTGVASARESGRSIAQGEFVQYLDSDDILLPRKFEWQVAGLEQQPECDVAYGKTSYSSFGAAHAQFPWKRTGEPLSMMFPSFLQSRWWGTSTPLYRRTIVDKNGPWLDLRNEEDWEYDCRMASLGVRLFYVDEFVSLERDHAGERLSRGGSADPAKLADRAKAHALILAHARRGGVPESAPEMRHFARALFLLARQCGAASLEKESRELFALAKSASGRTRERGFDFRLYQLAASVLGWSLAGKIACSVDRLKG